MTRIYDPLTSVDLDDAETLAIARGGWPQSGAEPGPHDIWFDVDEKIAIQALDDGVDALNKLGSLGRRARALQDANHRDYLNPQGHVVLEAQANAETAKRWALLRDVSIPKLDALHYGMRQAVIKLQLAREGLWRGIQPGQPPVSLFSGNLRSAEGMGNGNHFTISPTAISGDAPGMVLLTLRKTAACSGSMVSLVRRTGNSVAELDKVSMFHWCEDAYLKGTMDDVSELRNHFIPEPDGLPVAQIHNVDTEYENFVWKVNPTDYAGRFAVYALFRTTSNDNGEICMFHGGILSEEEGETVLFARHAGTSWQLANLGQAHIPDGNQSIRGGQSATSNYSIRIRTRKTSASEYVFVAGICLVPVDQPSINTPIAPDYFQTNIDGEIQRVYVSAYPSGNLSWSEAPFGRFLMVEPEKYNRFYLLPDDNFSVDATTTFIDPSIDIVTNLSYIPRYQTLR